MMNWLGRIFTWWNGATLGTQWALRGYRQVGEDAAGNRYYEAKRALTIEGRPRRWVMYDGANDASRISPEWHGWLHGSLDALPEKALPLPRAWQKPPQPNATGTPLAYRPPGALEAGAHRASATGDYQAWMPDGPAGSDTAITA